LHVWPAITATAQHRPTPVTQEELMELLALFLE
jgi:hypothetical protein